MATVGATLNPARLRASVEEIKAQRGPAPWGERIIINDRYVITVICQPPGHQNDWHYHLVDECWFIYEGELSWTIEGEAEPVRVTRGDWILVPGMRFHYIQILGDSPAIRIAVSYAGEWHRHDRADKPPAPEGARLS